MPPFSEGLYRSVTSVWRTLRSMRTALVLLLVVGVAAIAGSLVPQAPINPRAVAGLVADHPLLARVYDALGLFDVYGSWWFTLAYVLLLISLGSCLVPRTRALVRGMRRRPQPMRELEGMRHFREAAVPGSPAEALERSRRALRRRRFRVVDGVPGLAAEKGTAREAGSLLFHWSFFLLLVGVVIGKGLGFRGLVTIVEGETWTEAHANYVLPPEEGRFFSEDMHTGLQLRLVDFDATYHDSGVPADFVSRVEVLGEDGEPVARREIRVNDPLSERGLKLYQFGYGWAPVIEVRRGGEVLASGPVVFVSRDPTDFTQPWEGVVKLPSLRPQVGIELLLYADVRGLLGSFPMLEARDPFLTYEAYRGDLRLDRAQSVFSLDRTGLVRWRSGGLGLGEKTEVGRGLTVSFPELREYTQLQVKRDPGLWLLLASAILILAGLLPALYSSRRRVWVRARSDRDETLVQVAGFALQRKAAFDDEFARIAGEVLGDGGSASRPRAGRLRAVQ